MSGKQTAELIAVLKDNWRAEMKGYYTYQSLSEAETDPRRRNALRGLVAAERHHADLWSKRLKELDGSTLMYRVSKRETQRLSYRPCPGLRSSYAGSKSTRVGTSPVITNSLCNSVMHNLAILDEVIADEKEHYRTLGALLLSESTQRGSLLNP